MFEVLHEDIILPIFLRLIFVAWGLHFYDLSTQALCCGATLLKTPLVVIVFISPGAKAEALSTVTVIANA